LPSKQVVRYSEEEKERCLQALALFSGNARKAEATIQERHGYRVPESTIRAWRQAQPDRYAAIRAEVMDKIKLDVSEESTDLAREALSVAYELIEKAREDLPQIEGEKAIRAFKDVLIGMGIGLDKAAALRGDATVIHEHRKPAEILRSHAAIDPSLVVSVEAEEIDVTNETE
jgi:hypothetical protein